MKNRSNIASSILLNPELLEQAYERSANGQGVAQQELDTFLDSFEARANALRNSIQELSVEAFDIDFLKNITSFATGAVDAVTKLVDVFGGLGSAISLVVGAMSMKGGGVLNLDKNGKTYSPLWNWMTGVDEYNKQKKISTNIMGSWAKNQEDLQKGFMTTINANGGLENQTEALRMYVNSLSDAQKEQMTFQQGLEGFAASTGKVGTVFTRLGSVVKSFGVMAANIGVSLLASLAISSLFKLGDALIKTSKEIIEEGKEAQETIQDTQQNYEKMADSTEKLTKRYNELRSGVQYKEGEGFTNLTLSTDEFKEFLDINTQIADMFPSLTSGISSSGQVFVDLGTNVEQVTEKLNAMLEAEREIANLEIAKALPDELAGIVKQSESTNKEVKNQEKELKSLDDIIFNTYDRSLAIPNTLYEDNIEFIHDNINALLRKYNLSYESYGFDQAHLGGSDVLYQKAGFFGNEADVEAFLEDITQTGGFIDQLNNRLQDRRNNLQSEIANLKSKNQLEYEKIIPDIVSALKTDNAFSNLPEAIQDNIASSLYNIDYSSLDQEDQLNFQKYVTDNIINPISTAFNNTDNKEQLQNDLQMLFTQSFGDKKAIQIPDFIDGILEQLYPQNREAQLKFAERIGLGENTPDLLTGKDFTYNIDKQRRNILAAVNSMQDDVAEQWDSQKLANLTDNQIKEINKHLTSGEPFNFIPTAENGLNDLLDYFKKAKPKVEESTAKFSDLFPEGKLSETASKYESKLSAITNALKTYREEGQLTSEQSKDLMADLQLGDVSEKSLHTEGLKTLQDYITSIRDNMDDNMKPEEIQQYENYIHSIAESYLDTYADISDKDLSELLYRGVNDPKQIAEISDARNQLVAKLGGKVDNDIIATMVVEGDFSNFDGDIQSLVDRYHELEIAVSLNIDENQLANLKNIIEQNNNLEEAKRNAKEAAGATLTSDDYTETIKNDNTLLSALEEDYNKKVEAYNQLQQTYNAMQHMPVGEVSEEDLSKVESQLKKARTEMIQAQTDLENQRGTLFKDQSASDQADIDAIDKRIAKNREKLTSLDNQVKDKQVDGYKKSAEDYLEENKALFDENKMLLEKKNLIRSQITDANRENKQTELQEISDQYDKNITAMKENRKAISDMANFDYSNEAISQLEQQYGEINKLIERTTGKGQLVDASVYEDQVDVIGDLITEKQGQLNTYEKQLQSVRDENEGLSDVQIAASNEEFSKTLSNVGTLKEELTDLYGSRSDAKANGLLASEFNDDLKEAEGYISNIENIQDYIDDKKKEISSLETQGKPTEQAQSQLATLYETEKWNADQLTGIYDKVRSAFIDNEEIFSEYDEKRKKYSDISKEATDNLLTSEVDSIKARSDAIKGNIQDYQNAYDLVSDSMEGRKATHSDYKLLSNASKNMWKENAKLFTEGISGFLSSDGEVRKAYTDQVKEAYDGMVKSASDYKKSKYDDKLVDIDDLKTQLEDAQDIENDINRSLSDTTTLNTPEMFEAKSENLEGQLKIVDNLTEKYQNLVDTYKEGTTEYETGKQGLKEMAALRDEITGKQTSNMSESVQQEIKLQNSRLDELKQTATEYQNVLDNVHHTETEQDYKNLISNGKQQIAVMQDQIDTWTEYRDSIDIEENSDEWIAAQTNIDALTNSMNSMIQNTANWSTALENLPIDKLNKLLDVNQAMQNATKAQMDYDQSMRDLTSEDYNQLVDEQIDQVATQQEKLDKAKIGKDAALLKNRIGEMLGIDMASDEELANAEIAYQNERANLLNAQSQLHGTLTEQQEADLNPLITQLDDLQGQYDTLSTTISNSSDLVDTSTYEKQLDLGQQIVSNLTQESKLWDQIAEERRSSSEYTDKDIKAAEQQSEALQTQASTLSRNLQEVRGNTIISQFNNELKEAEGSISNIENIDSYISDIKKNMADESTNDDTQFMSSLQSLYEDEEYWATQLESLYSNIATELDIAGLTDQAAKYHQLADQYKGTKETSQQNQRENFLQSLNVSDDLLAELSDVEQRRTNQEALKKAITTAGGELTAKEYQDDAEISSAFADVYTKIIEQLTENYAKAGTNTDAKKQIGDALAEYGNSLAEEQANQVASQFSAETAFSNFLSKKLVEKQNEGKDIAREISDLTAQGYSVPDELYDRQQKNFEEQIAKGERLKNVLNGVKSVISAIPGSDTFVQQLDESITKADEDISNARQNWKQSNDDQALQSYNQLGYQLDELQDKAKGYQDAMSQANHIATESDYKNLIRNAEEQKGVLEQQLDYWEAQQKMYQDDTMSEGYQKAAENIRNIKNAINDASNSQLEWSNNIKQLPIDHLERLSNLFSSNRGIANALNNIKEATGHILSPEDYDTQIGDLEKELETAWGIVDEKKKDLINTQQMGSFLGEAGLDNTEEIVEAQTAINEATTEAYAKQLELINAKREQIKSSTNDEDANLAKLSQEEQALQNIIKNTEDLGGHATSDTYQGLLDNIFGTDFTDADGNIQHINGQLDELVSKRKDLLQQAEDFANDEDFGVNSKDYIDTIVAIDEVDQAMADNLKTAKEYQVELAKSPYAEQIENYDEVLKANQKAIDNMNDEIARAQEKGEDTDVLNTQLENLYGIRETWLNKSADLYREVAAKIQETDPDVAKGLRDQADEFEQQGKKAVDSQVATNKKLAEMSETAQNEIAKINNTRAYASSMKDYYKSQGQNIDNSYYANDIAASKRLQEIYLNELRDLDTQYQSGELKDEKAWLESRSELLENYYNERNKQVEDEEAKNLLPVENLQRLADDYSNTLDKVEARIDDYTEHGKVASEGMLRQQASAYDNLAEVYDKIADEYDKLAESETDLEKKTGFKKQAQEARQSALEYKNAIEDVNDTIAKNARMSTFEQLMDVDSDKGISNVTQDFQDKMADIIELQNQQMQGETLDLSQLKVEYPELAGITDLGDSLTKGLGKMKSNALVDYLDDYLSVISDYPDAIGEAQSMLTDVLSHFDFSDINLDDAVSTVEASLRSAFKEGKIDLQSALDLKQQINDAISGGEDAGREIVIALTTAWLGLDPAQAAAMYDHTQVNVDLVVNDENLRNAIDNLQKAGEINDAIQSNEESKRNLATSEGKILQASDYEGTIEAQTNEVQIQNATLEANEAVLSNMLNNNDYLKGQFESFMNDWVSGGASEKYANPMDYLNQNYGGLYNYFNSGNNIASLNETMEAFEASINASTQANNAQAQLNETVNEQNQARSNISTAIDEGLQNQLENIRRDQERDYARNGIRNPDLIQDEINLLGEVTDNLKRQISEQTKDLFRATSDESKWTRDEVTGELINQEANEARAKLESTRDALADVQEQIAQANHELIMSQGDDELLNISKLSKSYDELMSSIEATNQAQQDVPDSAYQQANSYLQDQISNYEELKRVAQESVDALAKPGEEGFVKELWEDGTSKVQEYTDSINTLNGKIQENNTAMGETPHSLQRTIDSLNQTREANNAQIALTEALGQSKTAQQIQTDTSVSEGLINAWRNDIAQKFAAGVISGDPVVQKSLGDEIKTLMNNITEEEAHVLSNNKELAELPAQQYLQIADQLSTAADTANRAITESIRDYGYADADLYKNYGQVLEAQKLNNLNLGILYSGLADKYAETDFGTTFAAEAEKYLSASSDLDTAIDENNEAIKQAEISTPFEAILRNQEGSKNISSIVDDIQSVTDAINEYQTQLEDGERLKLPDIQQEFAELSDVKNLQELPDALDDLQMDRIKKFYDNYKDILPSLSSTEREKAQNLLENVMSGLDLSNVDTSKIQQQIHDIIWEGIDGSNGSQVTGANALEKYLNSYIGEGGNAQVALTVAMSAEFSGDNPADIIESMNPQIIEIEFMTKKNAIEKLIKQTQQDIDKAKADEEVTKSLMGLYETQGYSVPKELYRIVSDNEAKNVKAYQDIFASRSAEYELALSHGSVAEQTQAYVDMKNAQKDWLDAREGFINAQTDYRFADVNKVNNSLDLLKANAENVSNAIDNAVDAGSKGTAQQYQYMIDNAMTQFEFLNSRMAEYQSIQAENAPGIEGANLDWYAQATNGIQETLSAQQELNAAVQEYMLMLNGGTELQELDQGLEKLESINSAINDQISLRETKGLKGTKKQYEALVENGEQQIKNLETQNKLLKRQQNTLGMTKSKWNEIQGTINDNNSAIAAMQGNIDGWNKSLKGMYETYGTDVLNALTQAFSESESATGLTTETMSTLLSQFSEMSGFDMSGVFYNTAQGIKLDVDATKMLVDAQYEIRSNELRNQIDRQTDAYQRQSQAVRDAGKFATNAQKQQAEASRQALNDLWQQMAQYQALYAQQQELFSKFGDWERAQASENAGAKFESIQGYKDTYKKMWESGLTGTDEYKTFTAMIDEWGRDSSAAYQGVQQKLDRYFTEDISGIKNFVDDLVTAGYLKQEGTKYIGNGALDDLQASHDLGIGQEAFRYLLGRAEDYNAVVDFASSATEAELKMQEATQKNIDAIKRYQELVANGAPQEALDEEVAKMNQAQQSLSNLSEIAADYNEKTGRITSNEIQQGVNTINQLSEGMAKASNEQLKDMYRSAIHNVASEFGNLKLLEDEKGNLRADIDAINEMYPGWQSAAQKLSDLKADYVREGFDIEKDVANTETWDSALSKVQANFDNIKESGQQYLDVLKGVDLDTLKSIDLNDGAIDSPELANIEKAADAFSDIAGLTGDEKDNLASILDMYGFYNNALQTDYARQQGITEQIQDSLDVVNDLKASEAIELPFDIKGIDGDMNHLQNQLETFKSLAEDPTQLEIETELSDSELQGIFTDLANKSEIDLKIRTELENAADAQAMLADMQEWDDKQIESFLNVDANTDEGQQAIATFKSEIASQDNVQIPVTIKIEDKQFDRLIESITGEPIEQEVKLVPDKTELDSVINAPEPLQMPSTTGTSAWSNEQRTNTIATITPTIPSAMDVITLQSKVDTSGAEADIQSLNGQEIEGELTVNEQELPEATLPVTPEVDTSSIESNLGTATMNVSYTSTGTDIPQINDQNATVNVEANGTDEVTALSEAVSQVEGKQVEATATVSGTEETNALTAAIDTVYSKHVTVGASVYGTAEVNALTAAINSVYSKSVVVGAATSGLGEVQALKAAIDSVQSKTVTVTTVAVNSGGGAVAYQGTMLSPALAKGTISTSDLKNLSDVQGIGKGKVGLKNNQEALVNEIGTESIIRDGKWFLIPGSPHVEKLQKGD